MHDITCSNPDELIAITDKASFAVAPGGVQALLVHPDGRVQTASASTKPTDGQILLVATGKRAAELAGHAAQQDARAFIDLSYRQLDPGASAQDMVRNYSVHGGPLLIEQGYPGRTEERW